MNAKTRAQARGIIQAIEAARADLQQLLEAEQDKFDNLPESFQDGDKGQAIQDAIGALELADQGLEEAVDNLNEACGGEA